MREVSTLISPTGLEMVIPLFDKKFTAIKGFVGVQTTNIYEEAKIRHDQDFDLLETSLVKMSNLPTLVNWFSLTEDQSTTLVNVAVNWMLGVAEGLRALGYKGEEVINLTDANKAIEDQMEEQWG